MPSRWKQVDSLFAHALDRPEDERLSFLSEACGDDQALYRQILALLDSDAEAERVLGESATDFAALLLPDLDARLEESLGGGVPADGQIGPYRIVREIGRGGMGAVYVADRTDAHFHKRVAIKLVKRGMDTDDILRRFRYERQILASLEHPNIARLYDGGVTTDGRPYLVMEYVGGQTIDRYCDDHRLGVDERLGLFQHVCEAVQFAHRNLIVHRDLKPANILVTEETSVMLLDFGIAKLLGEEQATSASGPITRTGGAVMTPEYASPEQLSGATITTASDVYSLGVVLYELLTGHRPHELAHKALDDARKILSQHPEPPSTVVSRILSRRKRDGTHVTVTPERISAARGTTTDRLQRRLRGDLDTILLTALQAEPERRYASADAFLEDVNRHLAGLPIRAQKDSAHYRLLKFVRRHRVGVVAAAAFVVLLVGFAVAMTLQQAETARERDAAARERDKAEDVAAFVVGIFGHTDPNEAPGDTLSVLDLLGRSVTRVDRELAGRPEVHAAVLHVLGTMYAARAAFAHGDSLLTRAVVMRRALYRRPHAETIESLRELADLRLHLGSYVDADSLYREAEALAKALPESDPLLLAQLEFQRARFLLLQGRLDEAEPLFRSALQVRTAHLGGEHEKFAESAEGLADLTLSRGAPADAEPLYRQVLEVRQRLFGDAHADVAGALNKLGRVYHMLEKYDESEAAWRRTLEVRRTIYGLEHPAVAQALVHLSLPLMVTGRLGEAEALQREALDVFERAYGPDHSEVNALLNNLAFVVDRQGRVDEAEALYRRVLAGFQRLLGPDHPNVAAAHQNVAVLRQRAGDFGDAETHYLRSIAIRRERLGPSSVFTATTEHSYALLLLEQGECDSAVPIFRDALVVFEKEYEQGHSRIAFAQGGLGACLAALGLHEEAEPLLHASFEALREARGPEDAGTQQALQRLYTLYAAWGPPERASEYRTLLSGSTAGD